MGWLCEKVCRLMFAYHLTADYVLDELDGAWGWVMFNWSIAHDANTHGSGVKIKGDGFIQQEKQRILKEQNAQK
jgi:hypothetical protein